MTPPLAPPPSPATPRRTLWQRRVRDPFVAQLTQGITPQKLALTIAVGSAFALFPVLGTTTLLCFVVALLLRLNQPIIQLINQALWPIHIPVIFLCVRLGERLFHVPPTHFNVHELNSLFWHHPIQFFEEFGLVAVHAIVAWTLLAPVYIAAVYLSTLPLLRSIARLRAEATQASPVPPDHPIP